MRPEEKKAAVAAYKERKTAAGVYAVTCLPTGERWVGASRNIDAARTGLWFQLRIGGSPFRELQAAWTAHSADLMDFEILERLKEDEDPRFLSANLRKRVRHWAETLTAKVM